MGYIKILMGENVAVKCYRINSAGYYILYYRTPEEAKYLFNMLGSPRLFGYTMIPHGLIAIGK